MTAIPAKKDPRKFTSPEVRLSFPHLFEKVETFKGNGRLAYTATLLIPPTSVEPFKIALKAAMLEKFGKLEIPGFKFPLRRCEEKDYAGYEKGWWFCTVKCDDQPPIVDRAKLPVTDSARVYAGVWCKAALTAWCYSNSAGKGAGFDLGALQIVRDDSRLDGRSARVNPDDAFDALELPPEDVTNTGGESADWSPF